MSRHNLNLLVAIALISIVCYRQADSAHRSHYGRMFDTFVEVLSEVRDNYVDEVDDRVMFEGAINGMMSELDPYSAYISPEQYTQFRQGIEQEFAGVGINVSLDADTKLITVMSPLVGTPAYAAGVLAGDTILKVDGQSVEGATLDEAVRLLRGRRGEPVTLTVLHRGETEPVDLRIVRDVIQVPTVLGDTVDDDGRWNFFLADHPELAYMRITDFGERTVDELREALERASDDGAEGMILDLRNNPGGLLTAATETCDLFVKEGRIVSIRGRNADDFESFDATGKAPYAELPLVVLVDRYSASASEIVAACLQDHERATVIGERTWGKGTVQDVIQLEGGTSALKLTTAGYWRPSNKNIHRRKDAGEEETWGVLPDDGFAIELSDEDFIALVRDRRRRDVVESGGEAPLAVEGEDAEPVVDEALRKATERLRASKS